MSLDSVRANVDYGIDAGIHEMKVIRGNDTLPACFRLESAFPELDGQTGAVKLSWSGCETYLSELNIYGTLPLTINLAQSAHAWKLIDDIQDNKTGGNYGFTQGLIPTTDPLKSRIYDSNVDALSAIQELASRNDGFDFNFDENKAFNCYYPYSGNVTDIVFEHGRNVEKVSYKQLAGPGAIANKVTAVGNTNSATATDTTSRDTYGLRETIVRLPNATDATGTLQEFADAHLYTLKNPIIIPQITINANHDGNPWGSYWVGDIVKVRAKYRGGEYVNINDEYQIIGITIEINDLGTETVSIDLASILPIAINRAMIDLIYSLENPNTTTPATQKTITQRIAELEATLSTS